MKYFAMVLTIVAAVLAGRMFFVYEELRQCKAVPDFRPALSHVKKFVGYERAFRFYVECTGKKVLDDCKINKPKDVTGDSVVLKVKKEGKLGSSAVVVDWVEEAIFYVDLSNNEDWDIDEQNKQIIFTMPAVRFSRVLRNESYLPYVKDRRFLVDDEKRLIKLIQKTDDVSSQKVAAYLKKHRKKINQAMEKSIVSFVKDIINKLGYSADYTIKVQFSKK